jgi:hypothetical protein
MYNKKITVKNSALDKKMYIVLICILVSRVGCDDNNKYAGILVPEKTILIDESSVMNVSSVVGEYVVEEFAGTRLYYAYLDGYNEDYVNEYIENDVNTNKEKYTIKIDDENVEFQGYKINIGEFYLATKNTYGHEGDFNMTYYDGLEGDFPVELMFFKDGSKITLEATVYFTVDVYEQSGNSYQFLTYIKYKKVE